LILRANFAISVTLPWTCMLTNSSPISKIYWSFSVQVVQKYCVLACLIIVKQ
jgi:hypothetical protein